MNLKYRQAKQKDLDEIVLLVEHAIKHMTEQGIKQWDDKYPTREDLRTDIVRKELFVGETQEKIAVIYVLNQLYDEDYKNGNWKEEEKPFYVIHRLCVNPSFQNCGIAKTTLENIKKQVIQWNAKAIRLDVFTKNTYALKLYESVGFKTVGSVLWRMGEFLLMEKYV